MIYYKKLSQAIMETSKSKSAVWLAGGDPRELMVQMKCKSRLLEKHSCWKKLTFYAI